TGELYNLGGCRLHLLDIDFTSEAATFILEVKAE
ncbi:unnamed protein product, partial [marine sediment metagenome]